MYLDIKKSKKMLLSHFKKRLTKKKLPQAKCSQQFYFIGIILNECHFKMTITFFSICLMTLILKSPFRFIED